MQFYLELVKMNEYLSRLTLPQQDEPSIYFG